MYQVSEMIQIHVTIALPLENVLTAFSQSPTAHVIKSQPVNKIAILPMTTALVISVIGAQQPKSVPSQQRQQLAPLAVNSVPIKMHASIHTPPKLSTATTVQFLGFVRTVHLMTQTVTVNS